jgi:hypothetical protein
VARRARAKQISGVPHELLDAFRACDDEGRIYLIEQWATIAYTPSNARFVIERVYYLRDGTCAVPNLDGTLTHGSTGQRLRRLRYPSDGT